MQVEVNEAVSSFAISHFQNKLTQMNYKREKLLLVLNEDHMIIEEQTQRRPIERYYYSDMTLLSFFANKKNKYNVFVIQEKNQGRKYSATFRHQNSKNCEIIFDFVNEKIRLTSEANQTETTIQRRKIIGMLKEKEKDVYQDIYSDNIRKLFSVDWLDAVLFDDHPKMKEYHNLAQMRANQNERKLIIDKARVKLSNGNLYVTEPINIPLEGYDFAKMSEGVRFFDDHKALKYVPKDEEKEEDLIVDSIPNEDIPHFVDTLEGLKLDDRVGMKKEENKIVSDYSDSNFEESMKLPESDKKVSKFELKQERTENEGYYFDNDDNMMEKRQFVKVLAAKTRCWLKIYYRVIEHKEVKMEHINVIFDELNRLLNSEPKMPVEFEATIKKTQTNIMEWKKNYSQQYWD